MLKRVPLLSFCFMLLLIINVIAIDQINQMSRRTRKIHVILDEIDYYAKADTPAKTASGEAVLGEETTATEEGEVKKDPRVAYLKSFLRKYDSELYDHSEFIVAMADKYEIDYRLIPAIAMQESNLCRVIPPGSHNCWGWGIYGNTVTRFTSYPEAIETVTKGLKENYVSKGLTTPDMIMKKYTPSSNGSWARGVNFFFKVIE